MAVGSWAEATLSEKEFMEVGGGQISVVYKIYFFLFFSSSLGRLVLLEEESQPFYLCRVKIKF